MFKNVGYKCTCGCDIWFCNIETFHLVVLVYSVYVFLIMYIVKKLFLFYICCLFFLFKGTLCH